MSSNYHRALLILQGLGSFSQLELLCSTLENDSYEVAEISFNFWYNLSEHLYQLDDQSLSSQFSPYVQRVILSLCKHVQLDFDHVSTCGVLRAPLADSSDAMLSLRERPLWIEVSIRRVIRKLKKQCRCFWVGHLANKLPAVGEIFSPGWNAVVL